MKKVLSILFQNGNDEKTLVIPEYYRLLSYYQPPKQTSACRSEKEVMDVLNSAEVAELWKVFATDDVFCEPEFARHLGGWQNVENTMASQFHVASLR